MQFILQEELILEKKENKAPTEVLIIKDGITSTVKGTYLFNDVSGKAVLNTWRERGIRLYFDYNHLSLEPEDEEQGKAAGWFDLDLREDGLWAVNIEWTDKALKLIESKEYKYISPVLFTNEKNEVVRLINVALTNLPATDNLEPLILNESKYSSINFKPTLGVISACKLGLKYHEQGLSGDGLMPATVAWARRLAEGGEWTSDKARKANAWFARHESDKASPKWNDPSPGKVAWLLWGGDAGKRQVKKLVEQMDKIDFSSNTEVVKYYTEENMNKILELELIDMCLDLCTAHLMMLGKCMAKGSSKLFEEQATIVSDMASQLTSYRAELDPEGMYSRKEDGFYELGTSMRLSEVIGKKSSDEQIGVIMALKESVSKYAEELKRADEEILSLKEQIKQNEVKDLVEKALEEGKLTVAQKQWALTAPIGTLKSFLEIMPAQKKVFKEKVVERESTSISEFNKLFSEEIKKQGIG